MKPILEVKKIHGHWCVFYANKTGGMWFGEIGGKPFGSHTIVKTDDLNEVISVLKQNARETVDMLKSKNYGTRTNTNSTN